MNALVTGATGFIGTHLVERLLAGGVRVRALVRPTSDTSLLESRGVELVRGDVRDPEAVGRAVAGCGVVYHLAKAPRGSPAPILRAVNGEGAGHVARAAARAGVGRLVLAGSAAVYGGDLRGRLVGEDSPLRPDSEYARSKALGERQVRESGLAGAVVARIGTVLGPGAAPWQRLFADIERGRFRMPGEGVNRHHLVDVADIAEGLLLCGSTPGIEGRVYNLAAAEPIRLVEMVRQIAVELGVTAAPRVLPEAPLRWYRGLSGLIGRLTGRGLPRAEGIAYLLSDRVLDISRACRELGYAPRIGPQEAIGRTAAWYRESATRREPAGAAASAPR